MKSKNEEVLDRAAKLYRALGHPLRLEMLLFLAESPSCVHDLTEQTGASQPLVSQHLRVLRQENLVSGTRSGKETIYQLADKHVLHVLQDAIDHIKETQS